MRETDAIVIEADDPIASAELEALARQNGWNFAALGQDRYRLSHRTGPAETREI